MRVKERILSIRLIEISKSNPDFLNEIGVTMKPSIKSTVDRKSEGENDEEHLYDE